MENQKTKTALDKTSFRLDTEKLVKKLELQQALVSYAHSYLLAEGLKPILSPKIVPFMDDELGDLIRVQVPGKENENLFMSRCPQFYKEIAALYTEGGKVYEIGPVFRGEHVSNGRRANEFSGLDVEIRTDSLEDIARVLRGFILGMRRDENLVSKAFAFSEKASFPEEIITISYGNAARMLGKNEIDASEEKELSAAIRKDHPNAWILLTEFPLTYKRAFYQIKDGNLTDSFDLISDWEICSGGLRRRDVDEYMKLLQSMSWSTAEFAPYIEIVKNNVHRNTGGFGIGLERLMGAITGIISIEDIQAYPRIPDKKIMF